MANEDKPFGFKPLRHKRSTIIPVTRYVIADDESNDLFIGDPVVRSGTTPTSGEFEGLPIVTLATAGTGNAITGILASIRHYADLSLNYYDASSISTVTECWVYDDPATIFIAQEDSVGGDLSATEIGINANIVLTHGGDTATGISGAEIDSSGTATTATLQLRLLSLHKDVDGNDFGSNAIYEVLINNHTEAPNSAGV